MKKIGKNLFFTSLLISGLLQSNQVNADCTRDNGNNGKCESTFVSGCGMMYRCNVATDDFDCKLDLVVKNENENLG